MKNTFGNVITLTLFGESHGAAVGAVLDGFPAGVTVDEAFMARRLAFRMGEEVISTARREKDFPQIVSGVYRGKTCGTPITFLFPNNDVKSDDYDPLLFVPRPGHADYTGAVKYAGCNDPRGGGHFSGRLTAPIVAAGAMCTQLLARHGIAIGTHIARIGGVTDDAFTSPEQIPSLTDCPFPVLNAGKEAEMKAAILQAKTAGDSLGGRLETMVSGIPAGLGEPFFDTVEGVLSHALFAVPGIKGVEFGDGFAFCGARGSRVSDGFTVQDGQVKTMANHNGGINGGIANGMPILFSCAVKPTPSIALPQDSVNLSTGEPRVLTVPGRHDPAIVHRACHVVNAVTALVLCDLLAMKSGTEAL